MDPITALNDTLNELYESGQHAAMLTRLQLAWAQAEEDSVRPGWHWHSMLIRWQLLADDYAPARAALVPLRDAQIAHLLDGRLYAGQQQAEQSPQATFDRVARFTLITEMNNILSDPAATCRLFTRLHAEQPALAKRYASRAMPALIDTGAYTLARHYLDEPLALLDEINTLSRTLPLLAPEGQAPRLAAELTNLVTGVRYHIAVLHSNDQHPQAAALREALLSGLEHETLRAWAGEELAQPGTITGYVVAQQMAFDDARGEISTER